jgi:RND family efflux transporter MFP subunit
VPPPPPKVDVGVPAQRNITRFLEATGNTAPIKNVDLVARVQGFLQSIDYQDGNFVKQGTTLFTIEPETYKLKLEQAQAAEAGAQASLKQAEADFKRQSELVSRQVVSQATLDTSTASRDNAQANLAQARSIPGSRRSVQLHHRRRRSTASSAHSSGRRTRRRVVRQWRPSSRSIRST